VNGVKELGHLLPLYQPKRSLRYILEAKRARLRKNKLVKRGT
jgi:hypothetical protein